MAQMGELFFQLGVKGSDKTLAALYDIRKGVDGIASSSFAAKAAITGIIYMFGRMLSGAGQFGQGVANMSTSIGMFTKDIQQFEQAGLKAGVAISDMDAAMQTHYDKVEQYRTNNVAPDKLGFLLSPDSGSGLTLEQWTDKAKGFQYTVEALQRMYANPTVDKYAKSATAKSLLTGNTDLLAALERQQLGEGIVSKQPFKSEGQIQQLATIAKQMAGIQNSISGMFQDWSAKHGVKLLTDFKMISTSFLGLLTQLDNLLTKVGAFKILANFFLFVANALEIATDAIIRLRGGTPPKRGKNILEQWWEMENNQGNIDAASEAARKQAEADTANYNLREEKKESAGFWGGVVGAVVNTVTEHASRFAAHPWSYPYENKEGGTIGGATQNNGEPLMDIIGGSMVDFMKNSFAPAMNTSALGNQGGLQNVVINQDINFSNDGSNYQQAKSGMVDSFVAAWKVTPKNIRMT